MIPVEYVSSNGIKLRTIFLDNGNWWKLFLKYRHLIRLSIIINVSKLLVCRTSFLGYHHFVCPTCSKSIKVPHSCKSRFCPSCGKKATDIWIKNSFNTLPKTTWQHITFTMPSELWAFFWLNRYLMNLIPLIAANIIKEWAKRKGFLPGIFLAIHTFGRDLKFHLLVSSGGIDLRTKRLNRWKSCSFIPYTMLHKRFRFLLIRDLKQTIKKHLQENPDPGKLSLFSHPGVLDSFFDPFLEINWYVHDSNELPHQDFTVSYIVRYAKRPPLAEWRILNYAKHPASDNYWVTFSYKERTRPEVKWTLPVEKFIGLLIQHIAPPHFRVVRYYGALANRTKPFFKKVLEKLFRRMKQIVKFDSWRERFTSFTGKDPLRCPICQREMELVEVAYFSSKSGCLAYYHPS